MSAKCNLSKRMFPYDTFKVEKKIVIRNTNYLSKANTHTQKFLSKKNLLNQILNRTKSVLNNKSDFSEYMKGYDSLITKSTFKTPEINSYPLLRKNHSELISAKNQNRAQNKIIRRKMLISYIQDKINDSSFKEKIRMNLNRTLKSKIHTNKKLLEWIRKKKERDKLFLFEEFFYKWNKKEEEVKDCNNNYSELNYNESNIFYNDYSEFIKGRVDFCKKNKLENLQKKLKINFEDKQGKKIKLELISMKLIFEPITENKSNKFKSSNNIVLLDLSQNDNDDSNNNMNDEYNFEDYKEIKITYNNTKEDDFSLNNEASNKKNIIIFPLSYVFLFYINGLDYFKNILIGAIKFSDDYNKINFDENEIYSVIRTRSLNKNITRDYSQIRNPKTKTGTMKSPFSKKNSNFKVQTTNKNFCSVKNLNNLVNNKNKKDRKKSDDSSFYQESFDTSTDNENIFYTTDKIIKKIHSNNDLKNIQLKKKDIKYSEYCFIWETPNKSYKVRLIMPIILYWSEHIKKNVIVYCDKDLFLFMLKNNFVNWDYYVLNYLFSLKIFRLLILKGISFYSKYNSNNSKLNETNQNKIYDRNKKRIEKYINDLYLEKSVKYIDEKTIILNINRKIYNQHSDNNESYRFFYTDNFSINNLIEFNSFHIFIESDKVSKKVCYEFCLNFKQMNYLTNIARYENLNAFLPKIVQTNCEEGKLNLDFSILEYYNTKIIGYIYNSKEIRKKLDKKNSISSGKSNRTKYFNSSRKDIDIDNIAITIKLPYINIEQYVKSNFLENNIRTIELNMNHLNVLKNCASNLWSKKILQLLDLKNISSGFNNSNLELKKIKSNYKKNADTYEEYLKKYNQNKRHSKSLHFKLRRIKI